MNRLYPTAHARPLACFGMYRQATINDLKQGDTFMMSARHYVVIETAEDESNERLIVITYRPKSSENEDDNITKTYLKTVGIQIKVPKQNH